MKWLKDRLDDLGKKPVDLARHLDLPPPRVYELLSGRRRLQTHEIGPTAAFLQWPESTVLSLLHGENAKEKPVKSRPPLPRQAILPNDRDGNHGLEVWASAEGDDKGTMFITAGPIDFIPRPTGLPARGSFAVYLIGDSMSPAYEHGDQIFVDSNKPVRNGLDCLFVREMASGPLVAMVKRLVRSSADKWRVQQFNPPKEFDIDRRIWRQAWSIAGKMNAS